MPMPVQEERRRVRERPPMVRGPADRDVLGVEILAHGDRDRTELVPGAQEGLEIDVDQRERLSEAYARIRVDRPTSRSGGFQ